MQVRAPVTVYEFSLPLASLCREALQVSHHLYLQFFTRANDQYPTACQDHILRLVNIFPSTATRS